VTTDAALAAATTLVALAFGLSTLDRWLRRRRPHELAWTIALALFVIGAGSLWWAEASGWTLPTIRVFFLTGAILNVPWLGLGTVYLLAGAHWGDRIRNGLVFFSGLALGVMLVAPTTGSIDPDEMPKGSDVFGIAPRVLAAVGSAVPAVVIIVGALWSAWRVMRHRAPALGDAARRSVVRPGRLALGNVLVATGAIVLSASGSLAGRLGEDRAFAVTLLVGICVLFAGFLVASSGTAPVRPALLPVDAVSHDTAA
jgi:hypothetical protein